MSQLYWHTGERAKFSLRTLLLVVTVSCIYVAAWAYREKERLALISEIERCGATVDTSPAWVPGLTGKVSGLSIPHSVYNSAGFPKLTRFRHLESFQLTDFKSDHLTAEALVITDRNAIRHIADRLASEGR